MAATDSPNGGNSIEKRVRILEQWRAAHEEFGRGGVEVMHRLEACSEKMENRVDGIEVKLGKMETRVGLWAFLGSALAIAIMGAFFHLLTP